MRKLFILFGFLISLFSITSIEAKNLSSQISCAPPLQNCLQKILEIPEARALIATIQKEGAIKIVAKENAVSKQFGAFWDPDHRIICIDLSPHRSQGSVIGSLLFELHNASSNSKINYLDGLAHQRKIDMKSYVEAMEYIEYLNSLNTSRMAAKGIDMGVLPVDAQLPTYSSFKEHLKAQKESGHSVCFERNYRLCL